MIQVLPLIDEDCPLTYRDIESSKVLNITFSYKDNDPITALRTTQESRRAALRIYQQLVMSGRKIYFCPDRDVLQFVGLATVSLKLLSERPEDILQILKNTVDYESRQLMSQFGDSSTPIKSVALFLEQFWGQYLEFERRKTRPKKYRRIAR
ncbi:uncharacterized protein K444DRAFT_666721 [Hyaloscypha bicolor E]|uniref:Uncharacterized protein n=1 Tax=Hyaloscypha bicolor E TaxID=1095630 RepID=A0A2J6SXJ3_9HELO|nr:uncharacterized protein K444DRAFT_666721 [Hyaloscypha bicolor E]PMD55497.1 hypothetical protein K444DRAFT_666721 [Hyaloscypha bicolor E]